MCDLMCTNRFMILEERLIEIMTRRGVDTNTVYHISEAQKLKKEIDQLLGYSVYTLFPERIRISRFPSAARLSTGHFPLSSGSVV